MADYDQLTATPRKPMGTSVRSSLGPRQRQSIYYENRSFSNACPLHQMAPTESRTPTDRTYRTELTVNKAPSTRTADRSASQCHKCRRSIDLSSHSRILFNNRAYHADCFTCANCRRKLSDSQTTKFTLHDNGEPLCSQCERAQAKTCHACHELILSGESVGFSAQNYHVDCFQCGQCRKLLVDEKKLHKHNSKPCCNSCYERNVAPQCAQCFKPISVGKSTTHAGKEYHSDCFRCGQCNNVITDPEYYVNNSKPCCIKCYDEKFAPQCAQCFKSIYVGEAITHDGKMYHGDCFRCGQCHKKIVDVEYFVQNSKPCCAKCYDEHFAVRCSKCSRIINGKYRLFQDKKFHFDCFTCTKCHRPIGSTGKFYNDRHGVVCSSCG